MILRNYSRRMWSLAVLAMAIGSSAGCRSTNRWNPSTWFAGREPDASMIAGRSGAPELPTSPSLNHTPTALANNYGATGGGPSTTGVAATNVAANGVGASDMPTQKNSSAPFVTNPYGASPVGSSPYGTASYGTASQNGLAPSAASSYAATANNTGKLTAPNASSAQQYGGQTASGGGLQSTGLAARSNGFQTGSQPNIGYQTGPYGMSPAAAPSGSGINTPIPTAQASASSVVTTPNVNPKPTGTFPSPYGGSYGPTSPQALPSSTASVASVNASVPATGPNSATGTPSASSDSWRVPEYPSLPAMPVSATLGSSNGTTAPVKSNEPTGYPTTMPANSPSNTIPPGFPPVSPGVPQMSNSGTGSGVVPVSNASPPPSAYQAAPPSGSYSPGTTGRSTNYNFGTGGSQSSGQPSSTNLPPNTATGNSSWVR